MTSFKIFVGLGNPEARYKHTYHNAGRLLADHLVNAYSLLHPERRFKFQKPAVGKNFAFVKLGSYILVAPLTSMNESGAAVQAALNFFKAKPAELLVLHDDGDIEIGRYKISSNRGAAGHHGVESIIQNLGTKNFWRLRIGIRHMADTDRTPEPKRVATGNFVLTTITEDDQKILDSVFQRIENEVFADILHNRS